MGGGGGEMETGGAAFRRRAGERDRKDENWCSWGEFVRVGVGGENWILESLNVRVQLEPLERVSLYRMSAMGVCACACACACAGRCAPPPHPLHLLPCAGAGTCLTHR
jgi:hypothetical protein